MKDKSKYIIIVVLLVSLFVRLININKLPVSLFSDEVDVGYQAYSLLKTGKDYFGNICPVSFHSFADFRASFYLYNAVVSVAVFGPNEIGVRFPALFYGVLGIIAFYFLSKELTKNEYFSLLATFILGLTPWHIHYSRAAFEATSIFFLVTAGLYMFLVSLRKNNYLLFLISLLCFILGFYTYATARLFLPLLAVLMFFLYRKEIFKFSKKKIIIAIIFAVLLTIPFLKDTVFGGSLQRFSYLNIFSDSNLKFEIDRQRLVDTIHNKTQVVGMQTPFFAFVYHSKLLSWTITMITSYISAFSFNFLFLSGDPNLRHGIGRVGELLYICLPFLVFGLSKIICLLGDKDSKQIMSSKNAKLILGFLLLAPLPSIITYDGGTHATRLFLMILPLILIISFGLWNLLNLFKKNIYRKIALIISIVLMVINYSYYWHLYVYHYPVESAKYWHYGLKEGVREISLIENNYDNIIFINNYEQPLIFFLFWKPFDPRKFNIGNLTDVDNDWFVGKKYDKYYFGKTKSGFENVLIKENRKALILSSRLDFGKDMENETPAGFGILKKIDLPSSGPFLYILAND